MKAEFRQAYGKGRYYENNTEIIASTVKMLGLRNSEEDYSPPKTSEASSEIPEGSGSSDPEPEKDEIPF